MSWRQSLHLFLCGWIKVDDRYYTKCHKHGITQAVRHGYFDKIDCKKCMVERIK